MKTTALLACLAAATSASLTFAQPAARYPISGYWLFGRPNAEAWRQPLARIHALGADTVIQFGPQLRRTDDEALAKHEVFSLCHIDGVSPITSAETKLKKRNEGSTIRHIYTLSTSENFGPALLVRDGLDWRVEVGDHIFWRLVVPAAAPGDQEREFSQPEEADVILVAGRKTDSLTALLSEAEALEMQVFVGMPMAPTHPDYPWDPWTAAQPVFLELAGRVLSDYQSRHAAQESFVGVYQSFELPVAERTLAAVLNLYGAQHALVRERLPRKRILVSPYWDARREKPTGVTRESVKEGIKLIARRNVDIIAAQDSRGTGKVGLFWAHEREKSVDARLVPSVGETTYGEAYSSNTTGYYAAASEAADELARAEDIHIELWANIEAFEPGSGIPCGSFTHCQRTTKERLDRAIMFAGTQPSKLISFMWDSLYTCTAGHERTLADEIEADSQRPIIVDAFLAERDGQRGIALHGYNIVLGDLQLSWGEGETKRTLAIPIGGRTDTAFGKRHPCYPDRLQEVWMPLAAEADTLRVSVRGPRGACHHSFSMRAEPAN